MNNNKNNLPKENPRELADINTARSSGKHIKPISNLDYNNPKPRIMDRFHGWF
jgi:hypothetical protein